MDWTGGAGKRYATPKGDSERHKQRQYFARARARARHALPSSQRQPPKRTAIERSLEPGLVRSSRSTATTPLSAPLSETHPIRSSKVPKKHDELRHELLNRPDWLRLSINQPLHRDKSISCSSDRIDKRCGIRKPVRNPRLPQQTALPGPSGFPDAEIIRIKVGTDALASQTQRSRTPSAAPYWLNTSMRAPSTCIEGLEEEPALSNPQDDHSAVIDHDTLVGDAGEPCHSTDGSLQRTAASSQQSEAPSVDILALTYNSLHQPQPDQLSDDLDLQMDEYKRILDIESAADRQDASEPSSDTQMADLFDGDDTAPELDLVESEDEAKKTWRRLENINEFTSSYAPVDAVSTSTAHVMTPYGSEIPTTWLRSEQAETSIISTPKGAGTQISFLPTITHDQVHNGSFAGDTTSLFEKPIKDQGTTARCLVTDASLVPSNPSIGSGLLTPKRPRTRFSLFPVHPSGHASKQSLTPLSSARSPPRLRATMTDPRPVNMPKQKYAAPGPLWRQFVLNTDEVDRDPELINDAARGVYHMQDREDLWLSSASAPLSMSDPPALGQPTMFHGPAIHDDVYNNDEREMKQKEKPPPGSPLMYDELVDNMIDEASPSPWLDEAEEEEGEENGNYDEIVDTEEVVSGRATQGGRTSSILEAPRFLERSPKPSISSAQDEMLRRHRRFVERRGK